MAPSQKNGSYIDIHATTPTDLVPVRVLGAEGKAEDGKVQPFLADT